ncbi:MAG: FeoB-associated Cys-rich membrane protein [Oscillospiraceae bacterium]|nr:FeoB-associated Cys-rich membrane protein [Oscillospiraceae bacterium]
MIDLILILVLLAILVPSARYVYKAKKSGTVKCIGCSVQGGCSGNCSGCSGAAK